ncbi:MAG: methyltransferase domain-containing protein [Planctomycetota bacterium]|nr:MAG: methyltransferase domain-containing protein [Planctomycetota bacterium]
MKTLHENPKYSFHQTLALFKALADETRLRLIQIFEFGPFSVGDLVNILEMGQSRISRHLKILHDAQVLTCYRQDGFTFYHLNPAAPQLVQKVIQSFMMESEKLDLDQLSLCQHIEERKQNKAQIFNQMADRWEDIRSQYRVSQKANKRIIKLVEDHDFVIDLGCGTGSLLMSLANRKGRYLGVDISPRMIQRAQSNLKNLQSSLDIQFKVGDIEKIHLPTKSASAVIASMVLHHLPDPEVLFTRAYQWLKKGGRIILHDFQEHGNQTYQKLFDHLWLGFSRDQLQHWMEKSGFHWKKYYSFPSQGGEDTFVAYGIKPK